MAEKAGAVLWVLPLLWASACSLRCHESDSRLDLLRNTLCCSLNDPSHCDANVTAKGDWPNQVIYMGNLLAALADPSTCLNTSTARHTVAQLEITDVSRSNWWYTWVVFQVQYYDMPRVPGARIESPATLGRKCWAFAYLAQIWPKLKPALNAAMHRAGLSLTNFSDAYDQAVPQTLGLCSKVLANCFVNQSYDPRRNGTCPESVGQFYVGYQWENGNNNVQPRYDSVEYIFPQYSQTKQWKDDVTFAVNTALNYII